MRFSKGVATGESFIPASTDAELHKLARIAENDFLADVRNSGLNPDERTLIYEGQDNFIRCGTDLTFSVKLRN